MSNLGVLEYNGHRFSDHSHVTVAGEMVYDDADRTVVHHRYRVTVDSIVVPEVNDGDVGDAMLRIRQKLTKAGGVFTLENKGFGPSLKVNQGRVRDVNFGPKPRILDWSPVGDTNAAEVRWECEVCIPTCEGYGGARFTGLATINYSVDYSINERGYTARTVSGYVAIAMTRVGRSTPDTADAYRESVLVAKPPNFHRQQTWNLSADKLRADFSITDVEIESPNAYPPGVVNISARHNVGWQKSGPQRAGRAWLPNVITADIELAQGRPRSHAWEIFKAIVESRLNIVRSTNRTVFIESLSVSEDLFAPNIGFAIDYRIVADISEFFSVTGLLQPLGYTWQNWANAIESSFGSRGIANMRHSANEDRIVDLCDTGTLASGQPTWTGVNTPGYRLRPLTNQCPSPSYSWLRFDASLTDELYYGTVFETSLDRYELHERAFDPSDPHPTLNEIETDAEAVISGGAISQKWRWRGYAERVCYDIPRPGRLEIGNQVLIPTGKPIFRRKFLGSHLGKPKFGASWDIQYRVKQRPSPAPVGGEDPNTGDTA